MLEKVALIVPTINPKAKKVISAFIKQAKMFGHNIGKFSIYLSIDTENITAPFKEQDFILSKELHSEVAKTVYINAEKRELLAKTILTRIPKLNKDLVNESPPIRVFVKKRDVLNFPTKISFSLLFLVMVDN